MSLENYDPNIRWGKHEIKVSFQEWEYKGYVTFEVGGNGKGSSLLQIDGDSLYDKKFKDNQAKFEDLDEDWYKMILTDNEGNELVCEAEFDDLNRYIVGVEIIGFVPE